MDLPTQLRSQLGEYQSHLQENIVMKEKTALRLGGVADFYFKATSIPALVTAIRTANFLKIPWIVMGTGERVLVSDQGFNGLVIHNTTNSVAFSPHGSIAIVDSGVLLPRLIMETISRDFGGLEFCIGMKGTIGGASWFNSEQFGFRLSQYVKRITICFPDGTIEHHPVSWFRFSTHDHKFMKSNEGMAFLTITLQLHHSRKDELIRRLKFYQSKNITASHPHMVLLNPLFQKPSYGHIEPVSSRSARLIGVNNESAEIRFNQASNFRQWIEQIKAHVAESNGAALDELMTYVGQW